MFSLRILLLLFIYSVAMSEVNLQFGEFRTFHEDELLPSNWQIHRSYSSRSLFKGVFGYGWCSDLDRKIEIVDSQLELFDCKDHRYKIFRLNVQENIKLLGNNYVIESPHKIEIFDSKGFLIEIQNRSLNSNPKTLQLIYDSQGRLKMLRAHSLKPGEAFSKKSPLKLKWNLDWQPDSLLSEISGPQGRIRYLYQNNQLASAQLNKKLMTYIYDSSMNMIHWSSPSGEEIISYDSEWDRVIGLKDSKNCKSNFHYTISRNRYQVQQSKICHRSAPQLTYFKFEKNQPIQTKSRQPALQITFKKENSL